MINLPIQSPVFKVMLFLLFLAPSTWAVRAESPEEELPPAFCWVERAIFQFDDGDIPDFAPGMVEGSAPASGDPAAGLAPANGPASGLDSEERHRYQTPVIHSGFDWNSAFRQSLLFLGGLHAPRIMFQPRTREELPGPFWRDYIDSIKGLQGWRDGDTTFTNYVLHPMMGAVAGYIQVHNDPAGRSLEFSNTPAYRYSRTKALLWSAMLCLQFEIGPFSEASIGNVGLKPSANSTHPMACVDLVITPLLGTAWLIGEDALDAHLIDKYEAGAPGNFGRCFVRIALNPCRSVANLLQLKKPWHRNR